MCTVHPRIDRNANRRTLLDYSGKAWSLSSIKRILSSLTYIGTLCYGKRRMRGDHLFHTNKDEWVIVPNAHPAIVGKRGFKRVQAILLENSTTKRWSCSTVYLLSGLGRCGVCGSRLTGANGYYRCTGRVQKGSSFCEGLSYRQEELEQSIIVRIAGFDADLDSVDQRDVMIRTLEGFTVFPKGRIRVRMKSENNSDYYGK